MAIFKDLKFFQQGGMDFDTAIEYRAKNDYGAAYNVRVTGTENLEDGYLTNIESNQFLSASLAQGINRCIGSAGFEDLRIGLGFIYNSTGAPRLVEINYDTQAVTTIDIGVVPLDPQHYVDDIDLINQTFLAFNDNFGQPYYINYQRLKSGGYGTLSLNDFLLIKQQPPEPITAVYNNDQSRSVNLLAAKGWQFRSEYVYLDYEYTPYSTISQLYYPASESTPEVGTNVTVNNNLILSIPNAYSNRNLQLIVVATYGGLGNWFTIKTINSSDLLNLPLVIDVSTQVYEAYNSVTNVYQIAFYNDGLYENIDVLQTDQLCDTIPLVAGSQAVLNGNELIYGDITVGYPRPTTAVTIQAVNYNPNLTVTPENPNFLQQDIINSGQSGSGQGNHRRLVQIEYRGTVQEHDTVTIVLVDIRNSASTLSYTLICNGAESGNTVAFIQDESPQIPGSSTYIPTNGFSLVGINIVTPPYFTLQTAYITLFNAGSGEFKSIHALKSNSSYQLALAYYDYWGRPFPLQTGTNFVEKTTSYGQSHGLTPSFQWAISDPPPVGSATYQWVISPNNTHQSSLYMIVSIINFIGDWNASTNSPTLAGGAGTVGDCYEITTPSNAQNLGNGVQSFNTGDFVVYNGASWDIIPRIDGDLSSPTSYYFYMNALYNFNQKNSTSVLSYDYTVNDRCTLAYYQTPGLGQTINWFDGVTNPIADVQVQGYNPATLLLKVNTSAAIDPDELAGKDVLIEIYTPKQRTATDATGTTVLNETVFYETGICYPIINEKHSVLSGTITGGDVYFKTREIGGSIDPNTLYTPLVEDFNFSDFYPSAFWSKGRPRSYSDTLETTEQVANLVYSEIYIVGSKINGLTRFYPANIYGEQGGQTSSNYGRVMKMQQINNDLLIIQELNHASAPVYINIIEDQAEQQNVAISESILGNIRYTQGKHIGIGQAKESFAFYQNVCYWIDPHRSEPIKWAGNGALPISGKMSKYFKSVLQVAYEGGLKIAGWYDIFNNEYIISIQQAGGVVVNFPFAPNIWQYQATYSVLPADITIAVNPTHSSASYNPFSGDVLLIPASGYVGSDTLQFSFPSGSGTLTKNACFGWTPGSGTVYMFKFLPVTGAPLSTEIGSNTISVGGNDYAVPISIAGGEYSTNGLPFTATAGTVNNGDVVQVEVLSSGSNSTTTSTTLTIDSVSATFDVTTIDAPPPDTVNLFPTLLSNDISTGEFTFEYDFDAPILTNDVFITYGVEGIQGGVTRTLIAYGNTIEMFSGNTSTATITGGYNPGDGILTDLIFTFSPSPNPSGLVTIDYTSPDTIVI